MAETQKMRDLWPCAPDPKLSCIRNKWRERAPACREMVNSEIGEMCVTQLGFEPQSKKNNVARLVRYFFLNN